VASASMHARTRTRRRPLRALGGRGIALLVVLLLLPAGLTALLRATPRLDLIYESVNFHLAVMSLVASAALLVALFTAAAAARSGTPASLFLALGCEFVGFFMLAHGLTTPGVFGRPFSLWVSRSPVLALSGFALCLVLSSVRPESGLGRLVARRRRAVLAAFTAILAVITVTIALDPLALSGATPLPGEELVSDALIVGGGLALLIVGAIHWRRWRLGRDRIELALVLACWLSLDAMISFKLGVLWHVSWWDYHVYLLAGFAAAAWAVLVGFRRTRSASGALTTVSVRDPMEHLERGYPEALHALGGAVEAKDPYTRGHSDRVAAVASRIGIHLSMDPDILRGLSQGALLHDIGKIGVPDAILNKPGKLTDDEWDWIRAHPVVGWEMASRAPSLRRALTVIRHHHERWDGSGYPEGLAGKEIPVVARIAAVADVWDALTSDRAYRPAWPTEEALAYVVAGRETLFDPLCVEAFVDVLAMGTVGSVATEVDPAALADAARACHTHRSSHPAGRRAG
jgi:HD-GYP domain-containing protein (c-di-GMP phosphodiesterase class II)